MIIKTYEICEAIVNGLKSVELAGNETNPVQQYSIDNFGEKCKIYNQIAKDKSKYVAPYIAVNEIGQAKKSKEVVEVDIDIGIPVAEAREQTIDEVISYIDREKLNKFASLISERIDSKYVCTSIPLDNEIFRPDAIQQQQKQYTGSIQLTYVIDVIIGG